jgi:hypothetical protein
MKQSYWQLLVVGVVLNCLGFVLSTLWTAEYGYVIESIAVVVWLNILLVLGAMYGRRWCVYVLAGVTLVGGVAQAASLEPRRFILSVLWLGAAAAFVAYLTQTRSDRTHERTWRPRSASRSIPTSTARRTRSSSQSIRSSGEDAVGLLF